MFMPIPSVPQVSESAIAAFCAALNTPVVNIEDLETGPARAAIVLSDPGQGEMSLLVRVSLISSGRGLTFCFQDDPALFGSHSGAVAAALGFAEGMGFLFDDDLIAEGGRSGADRAWKIWCSLTSERPHSVPRESSLRSDWRSDEGSGQGAADTGGLQVDLTDDLLLDVEVVEADEQASTERVRTVGTNSDDSSSLEEIRETEEPESGVRSPVLTKFRGSRSADEGEGRKEDRRGERQRRRLPDAAELPIDNSVEFARTALLSEEVGSEVADDTGYLTRLLSSF
jgi:hypothetical protein